MNETIDQPRTISKGTFQCLVWLLVFVLSVFEVLVASAVGSALGIRGAGGWLGGFCMLNYVLAHVSVDGCLKLFGLSRSGKTLEVRGSTTALPDGEVGDEETVEVRCPASFLNGLGGMCLGLASLILIMLIAIPHEKMTGIGSAYLLIAIFYVAGAYVLYESRWGKPQAWADAAGITGYPIGLHFRRKFVPWSSVATCEIETYFDTFGKPAIIRPTLKDRDGKTLLKLNLISTKVVDQERLVKYIKAKLPKPQRDLWD